MKKRITATRALAILLAFGATLIPAFAASANSAPIKTYDGTFHTGSLSVDSDCPLTVDSEVLTFNIHGFPDDGTEYLSSLTAEYRFFNPTDKDYDARLAFPFGTSDVLLEDGAGESLDGCSVSVDGAPVEAEMRYTYFPMGYEHFDTVADVARIREGYAEDEFFSPDMPVLKITYHLKRVGNSNFVCLDLSSCADPSFRIMGSTGTHFGYSDIQEITIYVMGSLPNEFPQWKFYTDSNMTTESQGEANIISTEEMTFRELALSQRNTESLVAEVDWYNAVVDALNGEYGHPEYTGEYTYYEGLLSVDYSLLCWLVYDMTVPARAYVTNAVSTPIYPYYDHRLEPTVYSYTYLLSPAGSWSEFKKLTVVINTPYYMINCSLDGFEKTDGGYVLELEGLPEGELSFDLCTSENPTEKFDFVTAFLYVILAIFAGLYAISPVIGVIAAVIAVITVLALLISCAVFLSAAVVLTVLLIVRKRRKKRKNIDNCHVAVDQ